MISRSEMRKAGRELRYELKHGIVRDQKIARSGPPVTAVGPALFQARLRYGTIMVTPDSAVLTDYKKDGNWRELATYTLMSASKKLYTFCVISFRNKQYKAPLHKLCVIARRAEIYGIDYCLLPRSYQVHHVDNNPSNCLWTNVVAVPARVNGGHSSDLDSTLYDEVGYPIDWDDLRYRNVARSTSPTTRCLKTRETHDHTKRYHHAL